MHVIERCLAAVAGVAAVVFLVSTSIAQDNALSEADQTCLACHSSDSLKKDLGGGNILSLHISPDGFAKSVHAAVGCASCHTDVKVGEHPGNGQVIPDARGYSIAMVEVCRACHDEVFKQQAGSIHADLLRNGNRFAPVCTDCHSSHAVTPKTAYNTCVACHETAMGAHAKWLPNAGLHLEVVSCAACHAPGAQRAVDLRLYDGAARQWVSEPADGYFEKLARSVDPDGNGIDPTELRKLMQQINNDPALPPKTFRGRIELRTGVEAHRLSGKTKAIKDCATCHREGAEPFQKVSLSVLGADGRPVRYDAHQDVLSSALSVESLREFYAVGGTRNRLLDALLVLAIIGGLAVPIGHQTLKWFVRKRLRAAESDGPSGKEAAPRPPSGDDSDRQ
jgi:Cytochrome c3